VTEFQTFAFKISQLNTQQRLPLPDIRYIKGLDAVSDTLVRVYMQCPLGHLEMRQDKVLLRMA
jgi:hypothetical protein